MNGDFGLADEPAALDETFRNHAALRPDDLALADAPDRAAWTSGTPRRLTYGEADRAVSALARRFRDAGLPAGSVVAYQLPNAVESVITLLAILRAGLVAAPLPLLWRHADMAAALGRTGAKALVTIDRIGTCSGIEVAMQAAAEAFSVRFVFAFGAEPTDGIVPLDDIFSAQVDAPPFAASSTVGSQTATITFDVNQDGIVPVARSHAQLIGAGRLIAAALPVAPHASILATLTPCSLAGLASAVVPWLLAGGRLSLHHPFSPEAFADQCGEAIVDVAVVPGALVGRLAEAGLLGRGRAKSIVAVWRSPERMQGCGAIRVQGADLLDVAVFGEIGALPLRRNAGGVPPTVAPGRFAAGPGSADYLDVGRTPAATLGLGGPLVPAKLFGGSQRDGERGMQLPLLADTGYPCRIDRESRALIVDSPPAGVVSVGGYRFVMRDLQELMERFENGATIAALPDTVTGHRLAGIGADRPVIREVLNASGANPLLAAAFRDRRTGRTSAA
jgi:hypothetical protein